jgi:hypothetical protein
MLNVINLFAGPGAGKSTTAAGLFYTMKRAGLSVELVTEYAKDKVYEGHLGCLEDQIYIFGKQQRRLKRLEGNVEWAITDSPLLLSILYHNGQHKSFEKLVWDVFHSYRNHNYYIQRDKPYVQIGRTQTEDEAIVLDIKMLGILDKHNVNYMPVVGDEECVERIYRATEWGCQ